ncbi:hypothetical protein QP858_04125 [Trueperella bernardiae]|uniref:Uncharacterized protein n=1 Tax=Trueperella bernardiae TaxID=59561 RepID=A0AAW6ZK11_9ACTO|nr:hypothetical protein [Trueperella bernardiae]MDK8601648.1 hypothetical protein [Trueperella bernardiae]
MEIMPNAVDILSRVSDNAEWLMAGGFFAGIAVIALIDWPRGLRVKKCVRNRRFSGVDL